MKKVFFLFLRFLSLSVFGQKSIGIACDNFKINNEQREDGIDYRKSLESVLSNLKYPPLIIEREKISELIIRIQEEINLSKDLGTKYISDLKTAKVDYIIYSNFEKKIIQEAYYLQMECIKIRGENTFSKITFPILKFTEKEITNKEIFQKRLSVMLSAYAFSEDFGIIENEQLGKINKRIDEKELQIKLLDSTLTNIQTDAKFKTQTINALSASVVEMQRKDSLKDKEIIKLNKEVIGIKGYSNIAKLDIWGLEVHLGYGLIGGETELSILMKKILEQKSNRLGPKLDDSTSILIDKVIEKYPKFPFGYYCKVLFQIQRNKNPWKEFATIAIEILEITTTIEGHKSDHDQVLDQLRVILGTLK